MINRLLDTLSRRVSAWLWHCPQCGAAFDTAWLALDYVLSPNRGLLCGDCRIANYRRAREVGRAR